MNLELMLPLVIYLVLVLGVGFWASRHRAQGNFVQEYFIGNRSMGGLVLAMTLVATYTSASSFIGGPGAAYKIGLGWVLLAMIQLPTVWLTLGVLGKKFAIIARRVNAVTINDMLWARYQSKAVVILGSITIILAFIATMVVQFIGGARLLETATGLSYQQGLMLFASCVLLYTIIGGFRAVVMTDALQGIIMLIGTGAPCWRAFWSPVTACPNLIHQLREIDPKLVSPQGAGDMLTQPFMLSFWILVCVGVVGLPHSALRCFGYRDSKALHRGILIGTVVSALLMFGMHLAGALGRAILPGMDSPDKIMPSLMMEVLPPWLAGVFLAAPMAAIMSTIDSQLIQASATLVKDLYLNYLSPKAGEAGGAHPPPLPALHPDPRHSGAAGGVATPRDDHLAQPARLWRSAGGVPLAAGARPLLVAGQRPRAHWPAWSAASSAMGY